MKDLLNIVGNGIQSNSEDNLIFQQVASEVLKELKQMSEDEFANVLKSASIIKSTWEYQFVLNVKITPTKLKS